MIRKRVLSKTHAEDEAERLVAKLFLFSEKALSEVKASGSVKKQVVPTTGVRISVKIQISRRC